MSFPPRCAHEPVSCTPCMVGVFLVNTERGTQDISLCTMHGGQVKVTLEPSVSCIPFILTASASYCRPKLTPSA